MTQLLLVVFVAGANLFITTAELRHLISAESKLTGFYRLSERTANLLVEMLLAYADYVPVHGFVISSV